MVKIEWNRESGFWVSDKGKFEDSPGRWIDEGILANTFEVWVNKDTDTGIFSLEVYIKTSSEEVKATEPGFEGLIKALNNHDWSKSIERLSHTWLYGQWSASEDFGERLAWGDRANAALDAGEVGTYTWCTRVCSEIYGNTMPSWAIKMAWKDLIEASDRDYGPITYVKNRFKGYALEEAVSSNGTYGLWLNGYKRKAVVGMFVFDAIAALGIDVAVYEPSKSMWSPVKVMEGDNLPVLAGDYASFGDVEAALLLQRLCGSKMKISDLSSVQVSEVRRNAKDVRFAKSLHSEVAANLDTVILSCEILKLKGLVEGRNLSEALCSAAGVELSAAMEALAGHKKKYLPHAIWSLKKEHKNNGLMPMFNAVFGDTSIAKLPENSLINLYIGDLTGCCQHLAGAGKRVCKDGWKNSHNCNYAFKSASGAVVAHMWVWMDRNNNLIIDSVEARSYASMEEVSELIRAFGRDMATKGHKTLIAKEALGKGRKVIKLLGLEEKATAGSQIQEKEWGYSDTDPGDECYVVS